MEQITFNIKITMPKRWFNKFIQILDCMRWCGNVGASRTVAFYADGDGDFRPFDFTINDKQVDSLTDWSNFDKSVNTDQVDIMPPYKTSRPVDFFFDAG